MTEPNYAQIAAAVYQACNHFDPYLPALSADLARAWGRLFETGKFTVDDLLAAVDRVYSEHGSGYRPLPKDITDAARLIRDKRVKDRAADSARQISGPPPATAEARRRAIEEFARRRTTRPAVRDITEPIHEPDLFSEPRHSRTEPEE